MRSATPTGQAVLAEPAAPTLCRQRRSLLRRIGDLLAIFGPWIILVSVISALWPVQFGGSTSFSIVSGRSMERTYHSGDLVITKQRSTYNLGDIVVYKIPGTDTGHGRKVVHRLHTRLPDGKLLAQGDNNRTVDPWTITEDDIVGSKWLMIPKGGLFLGFLRSPAAAAILIGALVIWVGWPRNDDHEPSEADAPVVTVRVSLPRRVGADVLAEAAVERRLDLHWLDDDGIPDVSIEMERRAAVRRAVAPMEAAPAPVRAAPVPVRAAPVPVPTAPQSDDWLADARIEAEFATAPAGLLRPAPEPANR